MGMNVLAGLAEGVLDAILEREDDPERDPFAVALARYRSGGIPDEAAASWRAVRVAQHADRGTADVLRKLDRDLLVGVVRYATGSADEPAPPDEAETEEASPTLAVVGAGGPMPSLELGPDGTWHVASSGEAPLARRGGEKARAGLSSLASRYPEHRGPPAVPGLFGRSRPAKSDPPERG